MVLEIRELKLVTELMPHPVVPVSTVLSQPQVNHMLGEVHTLSSVSMPEDPRDVRDSDYEPDEEEDEIVIILEGPAMGTRSRSAKQQ